MGVLIKGSTMCQSAHWLGSVAGFFCPPLPPPSTAEHASLSAVDINTHVMQCIYILHKGLAYHDGVFVGEGVWWRGRIV